MKIATNGICRTVFVFKKIAIKIPKFRYGWYYFLLGLTSNIEEIKAWKHTKSELLCPIKWSSWGGWIVVMQKAEICHEMDFIDYSIWRKAGFGGDNKPDNYGYLGTQIVKVDYSNFSSKSIKELITNPHH